MDFVIVQVYMLAAGSAVQQSASPTLVDAINKRNQRVPDQRLLLLNYSAVDPALTNDKCSFWHFRSDASADMRMHALTEAIKTELYLSGPATALPTSCRMTRAR